MKKNDIAILILIVAISLGLAYFVGQSLFGNAVSEPVQVESVEAITADVVQPSEKIFNDRAINPTVKINIGDSNNLPPFNQ